VDYGALPRLTAGACYPQKWQEGGDFIITAVEILFFATVFFIFRSAFNCQCPLK
jgi:hypothetical protein